MNRRLWGKYGKLAGLLSEDATGRLRWQEQIKYVFAEEDEIGIDRDGIKRLVAIAEEVKGQGLHPIFVMDSYRALLAASSIEIEENSSRYANPLRQLKKALGKTGSTVVLLHHSSQTSSKRAVAESNAGNAAFNSVPDQILSLKWLADAGADGQRRDRRVVLSASGRTGRVMPDQLLEQSPDWGWFTHGETGDALLKQNAIERTRSARGRRRHLLRPAQHPHMQRPPIRSPPATSIKINRLLKLESRYRRRHGGSCGQNKSEPPR